VAVTEGSPAEAANIRKGDVILEVEGQKVTSPTVFAELVQENMGKDILILKVMRHRNIVTAGVPLR